MIFTTSAQMLLGVEWFPLRDGLAQAVQPKRNYINGLKNDNK